MRFTTLDGWLAWLEQGRLNRIELGLDRVRQVLGRLDPSPLTAAVVTVAGTNGKGSSVALLEAIYGAAGYRTAAYTSPHLTDFTERIRIAGTPVDGAALCRALDRVDRARVDVALTYFEFATLAALDLCAEAEPDLLLLEVGLGGRLDACNVVDPDVALVTNVGLDHQAWLGHDREAIGREKAGIFRPGRPAVCGEREPPASLAAEAHRVGARFYQAGRDFRADPAPPGWHWRGGGRERRALPMPALAGAHQVQNAAAVLMAVELLHHRLPVGQSAVRRGLLEVSLPGRLEVVPGVVELILDVGHNPHAAQALANWLEVRPCDGATHLVLGMLDDKDCAAFAGTLASVVDHWYAAGLDVPRGMGGEALAARLRGTGIDPATVAPRPRVGLEAARGAARPGDRIVVCGSFHTVADVRTLPV